MYVIDFQYSNSYSHNFDIDIDKKNTGNKAPYY